MKYNIETFIKEFLGIKFQPFQIEMLKLLERANKGETIIWIEGRRLGRRCLKELFDEYEKRREKE